MNKPSSDSINGSVNNSSNERADEAVPRSNLTITKVELLRLRMPLKTPFATSLTKMTAKDFILVKAYGAESTLLVGYGESTALSAPVYSAETTHTVWHMLEQYLIPLLFKQHLHTPTDLTACFAPIRGQQMAKAALESAVWDLYCKQQNKSLSEVIGGTREHIVFGVSIGLQSSIEQLLRLVDRYVQDGYERIKLKITPDADVELVRAVRHTFGWELPLMADANCAYTVEDVEHLRQLDEYGLMMIEQPLAHDDFIDHALLQEQLDTPICLDESIQSVRDVRQALQLGSCQIVNLKMGRVGGLSEALSIHQLCHEQGIPLWCGGMLEAGVGRAHNIALASLPGLTLPGDISPSSRYWAEDIITPEVTAASAGKIRVPQGPGIGFELNEEVVSRYLVEQKTFRRDSN